MFEKKQPIDPPTLNEAMNIAVVQSDAAVVTFVNAVDDLTDANERLEAVIVRATAEIDALTLLRADAKAQQAENDGRVEKLRALIG